MDDNSIPAIFLPISRNKNFCDLSTHNFTVDEILFLVGEIRNTTQFLPREKEKLRASKVSTMFNINPNTLRSWISRCSNPKKALTAKVGRPCSLDALACQELLNETTERRRKRNCIFNVDFMELMKNKAEETAFRNGKTVVPDHKTIVAEGTARKIKEDLNITTRHAQGLTRARLVALSSIRVIYRWACLLDTLTGDLPAECKYNADATTFQFYPDNTGALVCVVVDSKDKSPVTSSKIPSDMCVFIKWMHLCSASGAMGLVVLIVEIDSIPEGQFGKHVRKL
jgi:hypothetical protein